MAMLAFAGGIALDRLLDWHWSNWMVLLAMGWGLALVLGRQLEKVPVVAAVACLFGCLLAGGFRHHLFWSVGTSHDIRTFCQEVPQAVRIRGVLVTSIEIRKAKIGPRIPSWMEIDKSLCEFRCEEIQRNERWEPVSGSISLTVDGHLVHVGVGDRVEILGFLARPAPPRNPGEPDFGAALRNKGIAGVLRVEHPQAVQRRERLTGFGWRLARLREGIRHTAQQRLFEGLTPGTRGVAGALLLGDRSMMTDDLREHFIESGTMHLLAISGLHVGILLGLAAACCKLLNLSHRQMAWCLLGLVLVYAALTNHRPPVLRATLLATFALFGGLHGRSIDGLNLLGVCGLTLLIWSPGDLFDVGAQLSFMAVAAILWGMKAWPLADRFVQQDPLEPERSRFVVALRQVGRGLGSAYLVTALIWLVTTPVSLRTFHVLAPVGMLLNVLLIPLTALILAFGYLYLGVCVLFPAIRAPFAWLFDKSLDRFLAVVRGGQSLPGGHLFLPDLPEWWINGYLLLIPSIWLVWGLKSQVRWTFHTILLWIAIGLCIGAMPVERRALRCTFLAMGHGLATIVELPNGQNLLYDAGTIGDGTRAERIIERALWSRGITHLDAILISHADHDHFSGIFGILEKFSVGGVMVSKASLDAEQRNFADVVEHAAKANVPVHVLQTGDRLSLQGKEPDLCLQILHPAGQFHSPHDNANSLVLEILYQGRRILLTGDLEKDGLPPLLSQPARHCDVLLAPHHGGNAANVPELYAWGTPEYVVVSGGRSRSGNSLAEVAHPARVLFTQTSGAITFEIHRDGQLTMAEFVCRSTREDAGEGLLSDHRP